MSREDRHTGLSALAHADDDFSVVDAIGGPRGVVESVLPGFLFVVLFVVTSDLMLTVVVSAAVSVVQVVARLAQRQSVWGAIGGLVSVAICLVWAWRSNDARNYYMLGFITNAVYVVVLSLSLMVRVPAVGVLVEAIRALPTGDYRGWLRSWLDDVPLRRAYMWVTVLWIGVFTLRLAVQVPLYFADLVGWLGTARLIMGIPFWSLAIWVSYLLIATPLHRSRLSDHEEGR
ncbi:DUF3159 domain-containing protein [uncultured Bifidobacterium sp.]|uniref:DUF3159 domain-containing protein n=1 Tax=uncultured Bifidobacterium sp. TaxID=165187 RepID=UPI0026301B79|nr:DUF3159 domain-containing protein [uncultured Bifidobacterium sp.]